ncbi:MAG: DUF6033 family protein [Alphaproteobacteria bacterium]
MEVSSQNIGSYGLANSAIKKEMPNSQNMSSQELISSLKKEFPEIAGISLSNFPENEDEQKRLVMSGRAAGLTIAPKAAERMQVDSEFRQKVIEGIKADQEMSQIKTFNTSGQEIEVLAHGTVVEEDGEVNSWTFSVSRSSSKEESFIEKLLKKLEDRKKEEKLDAETFNQIQEKAEEMLVSGETEKNVITEIKKMLEKNNLKDELLSPASIININA